MSVASSFYHFITDYSCFEIDPQEDYFLSAQTSSVEVAADNPDACGYKNLKDLTHRTSAFKEIIDTVSLLLSKKYAHDPFYFVFDEISNKKVRENSTNGSHDISFSSSTIGSTDGSRLSMQGDKILTDSHSSNENESQNIFGSPLKLKTIADLSAVNGYLTSTPSVGKLVTQSKLRGLSIQKARNVLRKFCQIDSENERKSHLKTIVTLCDGHDNRRTILLGIHRERGEEKTVLRTFCATLKSNQRVKLTSLQTSHLDKVTEYQMNGDYEMLDKRDSTGFMLLQAQWVDQYGFPRISNLTRAKFSVMLSATSGYPDSPMYQYYKQLEDVLHLFKALRDGQTPCGMEKCDYNAMQNLQLLFTKIKKGEESGLMSMTCDPGKRISLSPQRDSDFTDKLWTVFQQCSCFDDMLNCLKFTLKTLQKREMAVYVHKENKTIMAQLVRQSSLGFASFPPLIGGLPLKMIVEIGIEKIKRDYCAVLVESGLCTSQDLENFIKECLRDSQDEDGTYDVESVKDSQIEMLRKLHHCLELVCIMDSNSEHLDMKSLVNVVLSQYKTQKWDEKQIFTIPVMSKQAILQIKNVSASMIRREYECGGKCFVDCYLSELPDGLTVPICFSTDTCDVSSSVLGESKEFYAFQMIENTIIVPSSRR